MSISAAPRLGNEMLSPAMPTDVQEQEGPGMREECVEQSVGEQDECVVDA